MATARRTTDHDEIREWVERNGGRPAQVEGTGGMLRIDFGDEDARLEPIEWDRFFEIFDESGLGFLYDPDGHMNKFIQVSEDQTGIGKTEPDERDTPRAASRGRRKTSTSGRKKSSSGRKKTAKKSTASRKKSTSGRKKTAKKSTTSRKKSTSGRKKAAKKSTTSRKKSTSGRKKTAKKSTTSRKKSGGRKYGRKAGKKVGRAMHEMKRGQLRSGTKGPKVKSRKQAIAIGLSEARREGDKVPRRKSGSRKKKR